MADQERARGSAWRDPQLVKAEIAQTRARLSETIDEIEDVILDKKEEILATARGIRQRLDPFYKARQKPLAAIGVVFGAGLVLGVLSKGRKIKQVAAMAAIVAAPPPSELWEPRARRLLRIARQQREELAALREPEPEWEEVEYDEVDEDD